MIRLYNDDCLIADNIKIDAIITDPLYGVACKSLNRRFIGIELDNRHFNTAKCRIDDVL